MLQFLWVVESIIRSHFKQDPLGENEIAIFKGAREINVERHFSI
jgi:hypothetical protein